MVLHIDLLLRVSWFIQSNHQDMCTSISDLTCVPDKSSVFSSSCLIGSWGGSPMGYTIITAPLIWSRASWTASLVRGIFASTWTYNYMYVVTNGSWPISFQTKNNINDHYACLEIGIKWMSCQLKEMHVCAKTLGSSQDKHCKSLERNSEKLYWGTKNDF